MCFKRLMVLIPAVCIFLFLASCAGDESEEFLGSYTRDKTYSYDHVFYALQTNVDHMIQVSVYLTETDEEVDCFSPARASDFLEICWEKDSYHIWTQSADVENACFEYQNNHWVRSKESSPPDYIISKYDDEYKNDFKLWQGIYKSPTE